MQLDKLTEWRRAIGIPWRTSWLLGVPTSTWSGQRYAGKWNESGRNWRRLDVAPYSRRGWALIPSTVHQHQAKPWRLSIVDCHTAVTEIMKTYRLELISVLEGNPTLFDKVIDDPVKGQRRKGARIKYSTCTVERWVLPRSVQLNWWKRRWLLLHKLYKMWLTRVSFFAPQQDARSFSCSFGLVLFLPPFFPVNRERHRWQNSGENDKCI